MAERNAVAPVTQFMKMLVQRTVDMSDEAYDALEKEARLALIDHFVRSASDLMFSEAACEHNYAAEDLCLYLGSHVCSGRTVYQPNDAYVELWAWMGNDGEDFVMWNIATVVNDDKYPISYCPYCGIDLRPQLSEYDDANAEPPDD